MGATLNDITIYYSGLKIKDAPDDLEFRREVNFISDFYHNRLDKYKPKNTSRICIHLGIKSIWDEPSYFGSICSISNIIDEDKYLSYNKKKDRYHYILNLLHDAIIDAAKKLGWNESVFVGAYNFIIRSDYKFTREYPIKKSKIKNKYAKAIIKKDDKISKLIFEIYTKSGNSEIGVIEKSNHFWFDKTYKIAENSKWINEDEFGYLSKDKLSYVYYNLQEGNIETNLNTEDSLF